MTYHHTQRAPLCLILYALAVTYSAVAWVLKDEPILVWIFPPIALLMFILAASFHYLRVADQGDHLLVQFGPLPLFKRRVKYEDIESVEVGRTTILDGLGIHLSLRGGWVWNLWGRDCVVLRLHQATLRIGTNDARQLAQFVESKIEQRAKE